MSYSKRAFQRTVVLLEKKRTAVPVNAEMSRLINARREMDIIFFKIYFNFFAQDHHYNNTTYCNAINIFLSGKSQKLF